MELACHEKPVLGQLHRLHDAPVGRGAADAHARALHRFPVIVVELIAVAVAFVDQLLPIALPHFGALSYLTGIAAQAQGAALIHRLVLVRHEIDDLVQPILVELAGIGVRDTAHVPAEFDDRHLHTQADAEKRYVLLPGVLHR